MWKAAFPLSYLGTVTEVINRFLNIIAQAQTRVLFEKTGRKKHDYFLNKHNISLVFQISKTNLSTIP